MTRHVRALSATFTNSVQASAHAIAEAGQEAITNSTITIQRVLHYDQLPGWVRTFRSIFFLRQLMGSHTTFREQKASLLPRTILLLG